jgi:hypothetical protein
MALKATLNATRSSQIISVNTSAQSLSTVPGVTLRNQVRDINSLEEIQDVITTAQADGSVLQYNATTDKYEVKALDIEDLGLGLDGGTF